MALINTEFVPSVCIRSLRFCATAKTTGSSFIGPNPLPCRSGTREPRRSGSEYFLHKTRLNKQWLRPLKFRKGERGTGKKERLIRTKTQEGGVRVARKLIFALSFLGKNFLIGKVEIDESARPVFY